MALPLYSFQGQPGQNSSADAGLAQYQQQGQLGISPGATNIAASDPIAAAGHADLAQALKSAMQNQQTPPSPANMPLNQHPDNPTQTPGAGNDPYNQNPPGLQSYQQYPTGVNGQSGPPGGIDPQQMGNALQLQQQMQQGMALNNPAMQNYQNGISGGGWQGGGG